MITQAVLKSKVDYNPNTGVFTWIVGKRKGKRAGTQSGVGYRSITIDGKSYREHRLAWLWITGYWPEGVVDHLNHDNSDNRFVNLEDVSAEENGRRQRLRGWHEDYL